MAVVAEANFVLQSGVGENQSEKEKVELVADQAQEAAANTGLGEVQHDEQLLLSDDGALSPSPQCGDGAREREDMGEETVAGEENSKVHQQDDGEEMTSPQRITLFRDPKQTSTVSGFGVKVAGGVKCDNCSNLHAVITDAPYDLSLYKGHAVVEWGGCGLDCASYEEVRRVLMRTEEKSSVEIVVKECRGPLSGTEAEGTNDDKITLQDIHVAATADSASPPRLSPTDRDLPPTPNSLSPSLSPVLTNPPAPSNTSTPSPTPPPSPTLRRGAPRLASISDPRPASINIPPFRPQGDIVKPKFMINDVPTSPPSIVGPIRKYTIESFLGGAPNASVHLSLRYRAEDGHLRLLLHEVKHKKKKGVKSSLQSRSCFINTYLLPDEDKQGVRSCEVLSHVSDLENPQFYIVPSNQLGAVALRVILWETKGKNHSFVGEVLLSLADSDVVKLQGLPSWFPVCNPDPNLPPLPTPVPSKKPKKDDIFQRVRRGTGYALQSLRRPVSDIYGSDGKLSPSSSMDNLTRRLRDANVTLPRRVKKERRPLSALFSPQHTPTPRRNTRATVIEQNGMKNGRDFVDGPIDIPSVNRNIDDDALTTSLSVPSSPLLARRSGGRDSSRRIKFSSIFGSLRGSVPSASYSINLPSSDRTTKDEENNGGIWTGRIGRHKRSLSEDGKRRQQVSVSPLTITSASPTHTGKQQVHTTQHTSLSQGYESPNGDIHVASSRVKTSAPAAKSNASWHLVNDGTQLRKGNGKRKTRSKSADDILEAAAHFDVGSPQEETEDVISDVLTHTHDVSILSRDSSASSVEVDSQLLSQTSSSGESSHGSSSRLRTVEQTSAASTPKLVAIVPVKDGDEDSRTTGHTARGVDAPVSRWRSFDDLLGALPLKKLRPKWLRRNRTHHVFASPSSPSSPSSPKQRSHLLKRTCSEPAHGPSVGSVRLELTFNPDTSMVGVRLHEHTLSATKTDLTVKTYLFRRGGVASEEGQRNTVSFKKTHYSHTLVASFHCTSKLQDMALQVSLEASGRFFSRHGGHVMLDIGPLLLPAPSLSCDQWFPLFSSPLYPPSNSHQN